MEKKIRDRRISSRRGRERAKADASNRVRIAVQKNCAGRIGNCGGEEDQVSNVIVGPGFGKT
jgi:hypothetical protein